MLIWIKSSVRVKAAEKIRKRRKTWLFRGYCFHKFINVPNMSCILDLQGDAAVLSGPKTAAEFPKPGVSELLDAAGTAVFRQQAPEPEGMDIREICPGMPAAPVSCARRAEYREGWCIITAKGFCGCKQGCRLDLIHTLMGFQQINGRNIRCWISCTSGSSCPER